MPALLLRLAGIVCALLMALSAATGLAAPRVADARLLVAQADPFAPTAAPTNLTQWRGQTGIVLSFTLVGNPGAGAVWGTDIYTDDSALAAAAVHAGVLAAGEQGVVTIEILGSQPAFSGSTRNGIQTSNYGSWDGSFRFTEAGAPGRAVTALPDPGTLSAYAAQTGIVLTFQVTGGNSGSVWGDGLYTTDSNLAKSAVHAGVLQIGESGVVSVEILGPQPSFGGSERNGVGTSTWGSYGSSYRFVEVIDEPTAQPEPEDAPLADPKERRAPPRQSSS